MTEPRLGSSGQIEPSELEAQKEKWQKESEEDFGFEKDHAGFKELLENNAKLKKLKEELLDANLSDANRQEKLKDYRQLLDQELLMDKKQFNDYMKEVTEAIKLPGLKKFLKENCIFSFAKLAVGDLYIDTNYGGGKILVVLAPSAFFEETETKIKDQYGVTRGARYFNPSKAAFLIGRALGYLFLEPDNWKECAKISNDGDVSRWEDFLALCLVAPEKAEKASKEGYEYVKKILAGYSRGENIPLRKTGQKNFKGFTFSDQPEKNQIDFRNEYERIYDQGNSNSLIKRFLAQISQLREQNAGRLTLAWNVFKENLIKKTDWYERAVAEQEDKEANRIVNRQETVTDRDKRFKQLLYLVQEGQELSYINKFNLRTLIIADAKTSDFSYERCCHLYLTAADRLYKKSNGEEITEESYNFLNRMQRISSINGHRLGSKVLEYKRVELKESYKIYDPASPQADSKGYLQKIAYEPKFVRKDYQDLMDGVLEEIKVESNRNLNGVAKECWEYYKKADGSYIDIHELWGDDKDYEIKDGQKVGKFFHSTGSFSQQTGEKFSQRMFNIFNARGARGKLYPEGIALMARLIAEEILKEKVGGPFKGVLSEHSKAIITDAYYYYRDKFLRDDQYRQYVNFYLDKYGYEATQDGGLTIIDPAKKIKDRELKSEDEIDQETIDVYMKGEKNKIKDPQKQFHDAHEVLKKFDPELQDEENKWKTRPIDGQETPVKENGFFIDNTENALKNKFLFAKGQNEAEDDLQAVQKAIDGYIKRIIELASADSKNISPPMKNAVVDKMFTSYDVHILQEVKDAAKDADPDTYSQKYDLVQSEIKAIYDKIRPFRRELLRLKKLLLGLNVEYINPKHGNYTHYVVIDPEMNFQRDEKNNNRADIAQDQAVNDFLALHQEEDEPQKIAQLEQELQRTPGAKEKKKLENKIKESKKSYLAQKSYDPNQDLTKELSQLISDLNENKKDPEELKGIIEEENRENLNNEQKTQQILLKLIPQKWLEACLDPEDQLHKDRLIFNLRMSKFFLQKYPSDQAKGRVVQQSAGRPEPAEEEENE